MEPKVSQSSPDMELECSNVLLTHKKAFRSEAQASMEVYGHDDVDQIFEMQMARWNSPPPFLKTYTTLKLPYQAPSCPPLPSWEQIDAATDNHPLHVKTGLRFVCRIGDTVVKWSASSKIVEVSHFSISSLVIIS